MLAEETRLLVQRQRKQHENKISIGFLMVSKSHKGKIKGPDGCLHTQCIPLQKRNTELGESGML